MLIIPVIITVIIIYVLFFYNNLRTIQVRIKASIQEIGNQLKRQADLIPNLVESAKSYLKQEKDIFKMLSDARKTVDQAVESNDLKQIDKAQGLIGKALSSLKVVMESNPEIKSANVITSLMDELRDTADKLMYSRRTLIDLTADFNTSISTIPGVWLASLFGFKEEKGFSTPIEGEHLEVSAQQTKTPKVNLN